MKPNNRPGSQGDKAQVIWDAFCSHASEDKEVAIRLEKSLTDAGFSVWVDHVNIRAGGLLVPELMKALEGSKNILVLWSKASSRSKWVTTEWTSVVNLNHGTATPLKKGLIPCVLDDTPLAIFLLNYVFCDFRTSYETGLSRLVEALGEKITATPEKTPWNPSDIAKQIYHGQMAVLSSLLERNLSQASALQSKLDEMVEAALRENSTDHYILSLAGYHKKNQYMIRYWEELQAGEEASDNLLLEAMEFFFAALTRQPENPVALSGLGSVFLLRRDLDAGEFYLRRALDRLKEEHLPYDTVEVDLMLIQRLKAVRKAKA